MVWYYYLVGSLLFTKGISAFGDYRAPTITLEPINRLTFLNTSGGSTHCSAVGNPRPIIYWVTGNGNAVTNITELRTVLPNGTLTFLPFSSERYRQDIHSMVYRCVASNIVGKVGSRDVYVEGVIKQNYEVQVYDEFVIHGNTAVLKCYAPSYVRDYIVVTSWQREDGVTIISNISSGGRYSVLPNGELHIRHTTVADSKLYRCVTKHLLSDETKASITSGRLIITDSQTTILRLSATRTMVNVMEGLPAELTCVAQGYPPPSYKWYKDNGSDSAPLEQRSDITIADGSLYFQKTNLRDNGKYICLIKNIAGEERFESTLVVTAPLKADIQPKSIMVDSNKSITLTCNVSGHPIDDITWVKDQKPLITNGNKVKLLSREILEINSFGRGDRGVYQCHVRNNEDSAQASTELVLGATPPVFLDTFDDRAMKPGSSVSMQCAATGIPLPQITWTLDGYPIPNNERIRIGDFVSKDGEVMSHMNISNVRVEDGGDYMCIATNQVGELRHHGRLNVYGPPLVRTMSDMSLFAGDQMVLQCRVAGYPILNVMWEKGGIKLPTNERQYTFPNGTLVINDLQRSEDEGIYSCIAQNSEGATAEGSLKIRIKEKPVILITESVKKGMRIQVMCTAASGDPPFDITCFKDNQQEDTVVRKPNDDISSPTIESAILKQSEKYTCRIRNEAATINYTATLIVHVPLRWSIQPSDAVVLIGKSITLDCQAEGYPQPQIRWEKAIGTSSREFRAIMTNYHFQVFENGSLTIQDIGHEDDGHYLCHATNGIGSGLSSVVRLSVHEAPRFETKFRTQMARRGSDVKMTCSVTGDVPLTITWKRDKQILMLEKNPRFHFSAKMVTNGIQSNFTIMSVDREDSALYTCLAFNNYGQESTNIQLIVQEILDPPREIIVLETGSRFVRITWEPQFNGSNLITQYIIHLVENESYSDIWLNKTIPGTETTAVLSNLRPFTVYQLYIVAENEIGKSGFSKKVFFQTEEESPEGPPTMVRAESKTSQSLQITWEPPDSRLRNGQIKGYYVGYKEGNISDSFQYKAIEVNPDDESTVVFDLKGLKKYTPYTIIVQAFNKIGAGPRSDPIVGRTLEDVLPHPPVLTVVGVTSTSLELRWVQTAEYSISNIKGYILRFRRGYDQFEKVKILSHDNSYLLENLDCGTRYFLCLSVLGQEGEGEPSEIVIGKTKGIPPIPPPKERFITSNATFFTLALAFWVDGGCPIKHFIIEYKRRHSIEWKLASNNVLPQQDQIIIEDLSPGTWYVLRITAHNSAGSTIAEYEAATLTMDGGIQQTSSFSDIPKVSWTK